MIGPLKKYSSISTADHPAVGRLFLDFDERPLSGYLAGKERGGFYVQALEEKWAETFGVKHAIACNSATSGLLAAAFAVGLGSGDTFVCPAMTMSATAAAPMFTGARPYFMDVLDEDFGLNANAGFPEETRAIFTTNLFGHPSKLACNQWHAETVYLIEDNAQSPFAMTHNKRYAGTNGTIGVFSLNVHKHIQCGEGGIIVTDDGDLAFLMRSFINHGEHSSRDIGLNLRMPELCAAVALSQLSRAKEIIQDRVDQAEALIAAIGDIPGLRPPMVREGCSHVYYAIPFLIDTHQSRFAGPRAVFCSKLRDAGVPIVEGYVQPLYRLPAFKKFKRPCPMAEDLHDNRLFYFENCAWDLTPTQIVQIGEAFKQAAREVL